MSRRPAARFLRAHSALADLPLAEPTGQEEIGPIGPVICDLDPSRQEKFSLRLLSHFETCAKKIPRGSYIYVSGTGPIGPMSPELDCLNGRLSIEVRMRDPIPYRRTNSPLSAPAYPATFCSSFSEASVVATMRTCRSSAASVIEPVHLPSERRLAKPLSVRNRIRTWSRWPLGRSTLPLGPVFDPSHCYPTQSSPTI